MLSRQYWEWCSHICHMSIRKTVYRSTRCENKNKWRNCSVGLDCTVTLLCGLTLAKFQTNLSSNSTIKTYGAKHVTSKMWVGDFFVCVYIFFLIAGFLILVRLSICILWICWCHSMDDLRVRLKHFKISLGFFHQFFSIQQEIWLLSNYVYFVQNKQLFHSSCQVKVVQPY